MAEYTVVNLKDVEDMAPKFGHSPGMEARFARGPLGLESTGLSYQRLAPNFRMPFGHKHQEQEEIYVLLSGSARAKFDDQIVELKERDLVRVPPQTMRAFEAGPDGAELLIFGASNGATSAANDVEMAPGWWTD